jgi:hypothetical protein
MGTVAKAGGGDFPKAPVGTHVARCYQVIDLGHQKITWNGSEKWQPKVMLTWELLNAKMEDGRPFSVSSRYTLSLAETSQLRPLLESWRGKAFTDEEAQGFDIRNVLGKYCLLGVVHNPKDGKVYTNVSAALKLPQGMDKPAPVNQDLYFNLDTDPIEKLPEWIQNIVKKSKELSEPHKGNGAAGGKFDPMEGLGNDIPWDTDTQPVEQPDF